MAKYKNKIFIKEKFPNTIYKLDNSGTDSYTSADKMVANKKDKI